jgi:hypothetical protein
METGIILYNLKLDGCLNGVYTSDQEDGKIYNEIARPQKLTGDDIMGSYDCFYFDTHNARVNADLTITLKAKTRKTYLFSWEIKGKVLYEGVGYRMTWRLIAVHYWQK